MPTNRDNRYIVWKAKVGRVVEVQYKSEAREFKEKHNINGDTIIWDRDGKNLVSWCKGCEVW